MQTHKPVHIDKNFLVVSSFNNDLSWIKSRTDNYCIYERGDQTLDSYDLKSGNCLTSPNIGYNLYDYLTELMTGVNSAMGGINAFEVVIDPEIIEVCNFN